MERFFLIEGLLLLELADSAPSHAVLLPALITHLAIYRPKHSCPLSPFFSNQFSLSKYALHVNTHRARPGNASQCKAANASNMSLRAQLNYTHDCGGEPRVPLPCLEAAAPGQAAALCFRILSCHSQRSADRPAGSAYSKQWPGGVKRRGRGVLRDTRRARVPNITSCIKPLEA